MLNYGAECPSAEGGGQSESDEQGKKIKLRFTKPEVVQEM